MPVRRRVGLRLTGDQQSLLLSGGVFLRRDDESIDDLVIRLFGSWSACHRAWDLHRDRVMALSPIPGARPWGWWQWSAPPWEPDPARRPARLKLAPERPTQARLVPFDESGVLAELGLLSDLEQAQLARWQRGTNG